MPEPVEGLGDALATDGHLEVIWREPSAPLKARWWPLPEAAGSGGWLARDGRRAILPAGLAAEDQRRAVALAAAYASLLQGRMLLHAAAVEIGGSAHLILGASGAGKSTLSAALEAVGHPRHADDLTPCRVEAGQACLNLANGRVLPVAAIYELRRLETRHPTLRAELDRPRALHRLLRHGFGDLRHPDLWRRQFEGYAAILDAVPFFYLDAPDDLERLPELVALLIDRA